MPAAAPITPNAWGQCWLVRVAVPMPNRMRCIASGYLDYAAVKSTAPAWQCKLRHVLAKSKLIGLPRVQPNRLIRASLLNTSNASFQFHA